LDDLYAQYKGTYGGTRQDYFALLYLRKRFKAEIAEIEYRVAFNGNDYGLDAYYIDREARNLYLYQFKWSENHGLFKDSMIRLTESGIDRIFGNPLQDASQNPLLGYLKKELNEGREQIDRVYIHFVFKGDVDAADKSEGLASRREDLESKWHVINAYFGREIEIQVDFVADKLGKKGPPPAQSYEITFSKHIETTHDGITMYVGLVPLHELHRIYVALREQFFDRNIRGALPPDNLPNKKIREALERIVLQGKDEASVFPFRHNGVTVAAAKAIAINGHMRLHVPRILNGAQTVSSIDRFLEQHAGNPLLKQNRDRLEAVSVIAKIIVDDPASDFVTQVTISNNQQNPVHAWALRAMDRRQVDLADKFREELKIFYSRQEGVFENLRVCPVTSCGITKSSEHEAD
jgi:AIPR protein